MFSVLRRGDGRGVEPPPGRTFAADGEILERGEKKQEKRALQWSLNVCFQLLAQPGLSLLCTSSLLQAHRAGCLGNLCPPELYSKTTE